MIGNSVMRDTMFTMWALASGEPVPDIDHQQRLCSKTSTTRGTLCNCQVDWSGQYHSEPRQLKGRFAFDMWFQNDDSNYTADYFSGSNSQYRAASQKFFSKSTDRDVLLTMIGHNYPFESRADPTDGDRQLFLDGIKAYFPGTVVFALASPVYDDPAKQHIWSSLGEINSESRRCVAAKFDISEWGMAADFSKLPVYQS